MLLSNVKEDFHEDVLGKDFTENQFQAEFGETAEYSTDCHWIGPQRRVERDPSVHERKQLL